MKNQNKLAFTLVELIVVITILAILGTIAFIVLQGYSAQARDSRRVSDIQNIKKSLELFSLNTGQYPFSDDYFTIKYGSQDLRYQGTVGDDVTTNLSRNLNEKPTDPLTGLEYIYSRTFAGNEYELLSIYESDLITYNSNLLNQTNTANLNYPKISGNYNGVYVKAGSHYVPTPTIINANVWGTVDLAFTGNFLESQIITGGPNNIANAGIQASTGGLDGMIVGVFTGTLDTDFGEDDNGAKEDLAEIIIDTYSGTILAEDSGMYQEIVETDPEDFIDLIDVLVLNKGDTITGVTSEGGDEGGDDGGDEGGDEGGSSGGANLILAGGIGHSCYINTGGDLYCWGSNSNGQLGDGSTNDSYSPLLVGTGYSSVSNGKFHTCAITTGGDLKCWGSNTIGQLGDGSTTSTSSPILIGSGYSSVTTGDFHTCAVTTGQELYCWGQNTYGQLGDGTNTNTNIAGTSILTDIVSISAGQYHTCVVTSGGDLKCWGKNTSGQLGDGSNTNTNSPGTSILSGISSVDSGFNHTCAVTTGGDLKCWGSNQDGELGDGTITSTNTPGTSILSGISSVNLGNNFSCAISTGGDLKCWGTNRYGQVGDGTNEDQSSPILVKSNISDFALGNEHVCALTTGGDVKCWGSNRDGQLGVGFVIRDKPLNPVKIMSGISNFNSGQYHTCAITTGGNLYCWGQNTYGQLGDSTNINKSVPTLIGSGYSSVSAGVEHTCAITTGGDLKCWGKNTSGQLGNNDLGVNKNIPTLIGSGYSSVSAGGFHTCAIKSGGSLYCWGENYDGRLGINSFITATYPTLVYDGTGYSSVSAGYTATCGLKDSTLYCWGDNQTGQLGINSWTSDYEIPQEVISISSVSSVKVSPQWYNVCAKTTGGDMYCWGDNWQLQCGEDVGDGGFKIPQFQYSGISNYGVLNRFTCKIDSSNDVYCRGGNSSYIGNGEEANREYPPVFIMSGGSEMDGGYNHSCALKTNGDLYCWGNNNYGEVGYLGQIFDVVFE